MSRIDIVGQNGNDGLHYDKDWDEIKPSGLEFEYELDKSTGEVVKKYTKENTMQVKQQTTGNNDSLEDIAIAIMNLKTIDGKLIDTKESYIIVRQFMDNMLLSSNPNGFKKNDLEL